MVVVLVLVVVLVAVVAVVVVVAVFVLVPIGTHTQLNNKCSAVQLVSRETLCTHSALVLSCLQNAVVFSLLK